MKEESREYVMNTIATLAIEDMAREMGISFEDFFKIFRRSRTYRVLYDDETGVWMNGPEYVKDLYREDS